MLKSAYILAYVFVLTVISVGCSDFRKIQKNPDWKVKYEAAIKYYQNKDYHRSTLLFDEILPFIRGTQEGELVQFYNAYANYYQKQYLMSSHYFKTFYDTYTRSEFAEEAFYMYAYSLFKQSPPYDLDQTSTIEAINAMQIFLNHYPDSKYRSEASNIVEELTHKLELKAFENAKQYYTIGHLRSAIVAFDNYNKDYPGSVFNEDVYYYKIMSTYKYAKQSIPSKQKERYYDCIKVYQDFVDEYPDSQYIDELENYYTSSLKAIEYLTKHNL